MNKIHRKKSLNDEKLCSFLSTDVDHWTIMNSSNHLDNIPNKDPHRDEKEIEQKDVEDEFHLKVFPRRINNWIWHLISTTSRSDDIVFLLRWDDWSIDWERVERRLEEHRVDLKWWYRHHRCRCEQSNSSMNNVGPCHVKKSRRKTIRSSFEWSRSQTCEKEKRVWKNENFDQVHKSGKTLDTNDIEGVVTNDRIFISTEVVSRRQIKTRCKTTNSQWNQMRRWVSFRYFKSLLF